MFSLSMELEKGRNNEYKSRNQCNIRQKKIKKINESKYGSLKKSIKLVNL